MAIRHIYIATGYEMKDDEDLDELWKWQMRERRVRAYAEGNSPFVRNTTDGDKVILRKEKPLCTKRKRSKKK
jgi:hypothetical protein